MLPPSYNTVKGGENMDKEEMLYKFECLTNKSLSPEEIQNQRAVLGCCTDCGPSESE